MPTEEELNQGYTLGEWEILPDQGVMRRGDEEVRPEPLIWRVLTSLARREGSLVTRDDLIEDAWFGRPVTDDPINRAIAQVRKALGDNAKDPSYVETLQRRGYRLLQPVELHAATERLAEPDAPVAARGNKRWKLAAAVFAALFAVSAYLGVSWRSGQDVSADPSIGILPFVNETPDTLENYVVSGFKTELIASLTAIDNLTVRNIRDIERKSAVVRELEGYVRVVEDALSVRYLIMNLEDDATLEGTITGSMDDLFALQEQLAENVSEKLGFVRRQRLIKTQPSDSIAYDSYMRGVYELENRADRDNLSDAINLFRHSIELDADFGPSYLGLATAYALMVDYFDAPLDEFNQRALETIEAGIDADPSIADAAGSIYGFLSHKEKRWRASEAAHRRAVDADLVDANAFNWYSRMLASVGRLDDALEQAREAVEMDPSWGVANSRLAMSHTWVGNDAEADEYFRRSIDLGAGGVAHDLAYSLLLVRTGRVQEARQITRGGLIQAGAVDDWVDPVFDAIVDPAKAAAAIELLDEFDAERRIPPQASLILRAMLGDDEGAMQVAKLLELPGEVLEIELLFVPEMAQIRRHPEFMTLLERLGIPGYWAQSGCAFVDDRVRCD